MKEATYERSPLLHQWQIFLHTRILLAIQTREKLMELDAEYVRVVGGVEIAAAWLLHR
jgi:hypothetical protein